jgi:PAS domain-containing protein
LAADQIGRYLVANRMAADLTGFDVSELEAMTVWDLTSLADASTGAQLWAAFITAGERCGRYTIRVKDATAPVVYYFARANVLLHVALLQP